MVLNRITILHTKSITSVKREIIIIADIQMQRRSVIICEKKKLDLKGVYLYASVRQEIFNITKNSHHSHGDLRDKKY